MEVKEYLEKAKDRVIHEFEYQNGKYIQHYVLGGEHELKPQEIIDCLNALATMDCDLQTAYAYIKGQDEKNKQLKEQVDEQIDYKDEYYCYWKHTQKENTILKKALELACKDISLYEDITTADYKAKCYIEQVKESIK